MNMGDVEMKILKLSLLLAVLTVLSCKTSITDTFDLGGSNLLKKQIIPGHSSYYTKYNYNEQHLILEQRVLASEKLYSINEYIYDSSNNIVRVNYLHFSNIRKSSYTLLEYTDNNQLLKSISYIENEVNKYELQGHTLYEYNDKGRISICRMYSADGNDSYWIEYDYDSIGNIIEHRKYEEGQLSFVNRYEYDDKINPLMGTDVKMAALYISPNNVVKMLWKNLSVDDSFNKNSYSYTYNSKEYPIDLRQGLWYFEYEYY